ncbi:MAG: putative sulfate exporter family transporter [Bacteroidales bacterium]|nr:putative sulfate exporter family transporter [Bacteroidales bacterium]MBQ3521472.1 putative sulfate exporter family transporter [Bacteroidales bacterium]MBR1950098.1 putative sulfate exporter family transporter [Bacteroidales bacterium]MBR3609759.1 putative sulfate exporter family transporter [Bacteroidales bacterium]
MKNLKKIIFLLLLAVSVFVSPAVALFAGIVLALFVGNPYGALSKKVSKYLLQAAVVGLGFGMNLHESLAAGKDGIIFTIVSVTGVMVIGYSIGRMMGILPKLSYLISAGTAICGGSAIAAVSPVVKADDNETSISLAVIFTLNAIALFIFPPIGEMLGLTQNQFGLWAAIAIHDTSSVVGAASIYGEEALKVATTVKLTRALWIIPLSIVSIFIFARQNRNQEGEKTKINIPWFIFLFILAMVINTYISLPEGLLEVIKVASHKALSVTLFLIGCGLSVASIKKVGFKPVLLGVILWIIISVVTLFVVL